ncbi:DNA polymerase III subunit epsilon-like [Clinocottus analis]|uniref:DNA polymerase III subunit epsilon-like n=1 Tax=Clinocottus analis TaxID=304258 RepID=UPI0035BF8B7C
MSHNQAIVFFDLETTGLDTKVCHIIQLAATCEGNSFNMYVLPWRPIDEGASRVNGFTGGNGELWLHGVPVTAYPIADALKYFINFLRSFQRPVLLAAHNAAGFDAPLLSLVIRKLRLLKEFQQVVYGYMDTLLLSRNLYDLPKNNLKYLVRHFLNKSYDAHNAAADAMVLEELFNCWNPHPQDVSRVTYSF